MMDNNIFNNDQGNEDTSEYPKQPEVNNTPEQASPVAPTHTPSETEAPSVTLGGAYRAPVNPTPVEPTPSVTAGETPGAPVNPTPVREPVQGPTATENTEPKPTPTPATYSYTSGSNPTINRADPVTTPQNTPQNTAKGPGVHTTYVPHYVPRYVPNSVSQPAAKKTKKERKGIPVIALVLCLCAGILLSGIAGAFGVYVGTQLNSTNGTAIHRDNSSLNGNNTIDATPSEKVEVKLPEGTVAAAADLAGDSVVEITTETVTTSFFYGQFVQSGAGSGVIIDADDGYIITCAHVINGASAVTVTLKDGSNYEAEIVGSDSRTDIAVIKINADNLVAAELGNSDNLVVGQTAIAIGNPLGTLGGTVSSGIISALNREITIEGQGYSLLQIDTSINPGNSGGGLFDIEGKLIGVVNAKSGGDGSGTTIEGLGFAIPINQALDVANSLVNDGYVSGRANLGIMVYEINQNTSTASLYQSEYADLLDYITDYGVYFIEYQPGQNGNFEFGDRIIAIDGVSVSARSDISSLLEEYEVGDEITVTVSRVTSDMKRSRIVQFETTLVENVPEQAQTDIETNEK